jgi:NAD(P)-dependent dehydrogenase (short-subunit alcohol dehydrogenase family)
LGQATAIGLAEADADIIAVSHSESHETVKSNNLNSLNSLFFLSQLVGNHMIERGRGKIINIASLLTYQGGINVPGYTASKCVDGGWMAR